MVVNVNVKEAVKSATEYFIELMNGKISGVMLEEVDITPDDKDLLVTLSAWVPDSKPPTTTPTAATLAELFQPAHVRIYRIFDIDAETGKVKSMKVRKVE